MVTVQQVKNYLKVEFEDDDELIKMLIDIADSYIETELGKSFKKEKIEPPKEICLAILLLISYWYDNRTAMVVIKNKQLTTEVKFGVATLLNPYKVRQM